MKSVYEFTSDAPKKQKMDECYTRWPLWMLEYLGQPRKSNTLAAVTLMHSMSYLRTVETIGGRAAAVAEFFEQLGDRFCAFDGAPTSKALVKDACRWLDEILDGLKRYARDRQDKSTLSAIRKFMVKEIKQAYKDN